MLIGMMGVGKSTVGRALASTLGWTYLDSDEQVHATTGRTVKEISMTDGADALHRFEDAALVAALDTRDPAVISVAGGAVLSQANRTLLKDERHVVWLRASIQTMAARIGNAGDRPFFDRHPLATIEALYDVRRPFYAEVATLTIDVDELDPGAVVERILAAS